MPTKPVKKPTIRELQRELAVVNDALSIALSASPITDNNFFPGGMSSAYDDRNSWDRKTIFSESLRAWRVNPIARRIVRLIRSFILGKGLTIKCSNVETQKFLIEWWNDPLNKFKKNIKRWVDENTRTGNLFFLCTVQANHMTHIRAVPAERIEEILVKENDIEQETRYARDPAGSEFYEAYNPLEEQTSFMLHFASNQPVGSAWGEGDLPPLLVWIGRYSTWLEDRVRLNHFRTAFMYAITGSYKSETERSAREKFLNANPPKSGSTLVLNKDNGETWETISPKLESDDANTDGLAVKKNILSGLGFPMHWFAEPEGSNRTTAEAAGTPTFRTLEETQDELFDMLIEMARIVLEVRSRSDKSIDPKAEIWIEGTDITERDNAVLALALGRAYPNLADMFDRDAIDAKEFMRLVYKTFAEIWDVKTIPTIKKKPLFKPAKDTAMPEPKDDPDDPKEEKE